MENNKEVKNIADYPLEAPPPQGLPLAENPLRRPELQQLPVREEIKASPDMDQDSDEECCCCSHGCSRGCRIDPCGAWSWAFAITCILCLEVMTCCCCCQHCR